VEVTNLLEHGLRQVTAPPELWDRVQSARVSRPQTTSRGFVWAWAMAATVVLTAVALSRVQSPVHQDSQLTALRCQNPAQLRAWVRAKTGFDVPMRTALPASIQLIGARAVEGRVEIAYRAGNRDAMLLVSRADPGSANAPHSRVSGKVSSWVMDGQRFTLACNDPAGLQMACKLCHLD
jgi:hypothetical protein